MGGRAFTVPSHNAFRRGYFRPRTPLRGVEAAAPLPSWEESVTKTEFREGTGNSLEIRGYNSGSIEAFEQPAF
jgi:hypothetical protein